MAKGKKKGGTYENTIIKVLAKALASLDITPDDIYRTKNSGATKDQPGDIGFSSRAAKIFPLLVECKHYANIKHKLGKDIDKQPKSFPIQEWWKQVDKEQKERKDKFGVLIFRQNNCPDIIALRASHYTALMDRLPVWENYRWSMFCMYKKETIVFVPLDAFLKKYVRKRLRDRQRKREQRARNK